MLLLMIKYIKREKQEAVLERYYEDFVKRDSFRRNLQNMASYDHLRLTKKSTENDPRNV